jgi:hypothetical protein
MAPVAVRLAAGRRSARGAKGQRCLIVTCDPPSDQGMDGGGALGRVHVGRQREDRRFVCERRVRVGSKGEVRTDFKGASVCVCPGEGAARGPEVEARAAGARRRWQARGSASRRHRPLNSAPGTLFGRAYLQKVE